MDCSLPGSSLHGILHQEYWSAFPCSAPGKLSYPGIEPMSLMSPALAGGFFTTSATWEACLNHYILFHFRQPAPHKVYNEENKRRESILKYFACSQTYSKVKKHRASQWVIRISNKRITSYLSILLHCKVKWNSTCIRD